VSFLERREILIILAVLLVDGESKLDHSVDSVGEGVGFV